MKKIILSILSALILAMSFTSCNDISFINRIESTPEPTATPTISPTPTATASPTPTATPTVKPVVTATPTPTPTPTPTVEPSPEPQKEVLTMDDLIFIGDSTTYGLKYYGVLSGGKNTKQVWVPENGTLTLSYQSTAKIVYPETGEQITITEAVQRAQPKAIVITLGVNGVAFMNEDYFTSQYEDLVTRIQENSPDTKIILNSIYPVASYYKYINSISNTKITKANKWIKAIADKYDLTFIQSGELLKDNDGFLMSKYTNGDGLHLNPSAFELVLDEIEKNIN